MRSRTSVALALACFAVFLAEPVVGADAKTMKERVIQQLAEFTASADHPPKKRDLPTYGTQDGSTINVPSYEFQGMDPYADQISDDGSNYRYFRTIATGSQFMAAPVHLPSGVVIDYVRVSNCVHADGDFGVTLWDNGWGGGGSCDDCGPHAEIAFVPAVSGCGEDGQENIEYAYDGNLGHPLVLLVFWDGATDGTTKFSGVAIGYHRVVSPAPGAPTFTDVSISDPGFQYIEALVASGITAGCGGGKYCPDSPLTRRQMAVFLSKALGLHWPN